jgi:hypothetical protein
MKKVAFPLLITAAGLATAGWVGTKIQPGPLPAYPQASPQVKTMPLPSGLPDPVERFYREIYGDEVPLIESAVISGRTKLRMFGLSLPGRFRFIHIAGHEYRHYMEATWFGLPIMKVHETYLDGRSRLELPFGVVDNEPKVNQAANLGLWAESMWLPAIFVTDPRVRWNPVDGETAILVMPFGDGEDQFIVRFDPHSGLLRLMEAMRFKDAGAESKTLWICEALEWAAIGGKPTLKTGSLTWFDDGYPWAVFDTFEVVLNVDVSSYIQEKGY